MFKLGVNKRVLSIDIGNSGIRLIEVERRENEQLYIVNYLTHDYLMTNHEDSLEEKASDALVSIFAEHSFKATECYISVPVGEVYIRFAKLPAVNLSNEKIREIVEYEALQYIPYDIGNVVLDYQLMGNHDSRLEVMFVVARDDFMQKLESIFKSLHYTINFVDISVCANYNVAKANFIGHEGCDLCISIGGKETFFYFLHKGLFFVRKVSFGGDDLTKAIAVKCNLTFLKAEILKKRYSETNGTGIKDEGTTAILKKEINIFLDEISIEIGRSINQYRSEKDGIKPQKIFLGGGSSTVPGIVKFIKEKIRIPVDYLNVFNCFKIDDAIDHIAIAHEAHILSVALGNALRGFYSCPIEISLKSKNSAFQQKMRNKMGYFLMLYVILLIYPIIGHYDANKTIQNYSEQIEQNKTIVRKHSLIYNTIKTNNAKAEVIENKLDTLNDLVNHRVDWLNLVKVFEENIPQGIWLTSIKPIISNNDATVSISTTKSKKIEIDEILQKKIEWQRNNKLPFKKGEVDSFLIEGYAIYKVLIGDIKESLPEQFLEKLKEYDLKFIMFDEALSRVKNESILDEAGNLTSFEIVITLFKPLLGNR